jgi:hypothetical protein
MVPDDSEKTRFLTLMAWEAEEYEYKEKSPDWYWAVGIITLGFFVTAIILKNFLFALLALIGGFTFAMYGAARPKSVSFAITSRGIKIGDKLYPYDNLKSFWINYDPPHIREIYIISKKFFVPQINIPLGKIDPNEVREHLLKFLEEKEIPESLFDSIARFFRF